MTVLCKSEIVDALRTGKLIHSLVPNEGERRTFERWVDDWIQPASIDLTIGPELATFYDHPITQNTQARFHPRDLPLTDPRQDSRQFFVIRDINDLPNKRGLLQPGGMVLARTEAVIGLDHSLAGQVATRSTARRWGLDVCGSAGWVDPGFHSYLTLEIVNTTTRPIYIYAGMRIAQLVLFRTENTSEVTYESHYKVSPALWKPENMLPKPL